MNSNLRYSYLKQITESYKPYRGTTDKYNFDDRKHGYKYFYPRVVNGETEYHVGYYHTWRSDEMTDAEFDEAKKNMDEKELKRWQRNHKWNEQTRNYDDDGYVRNYKDPKIDLIIRSDDTVEIVTSDFHQGMRQIFSAYSYSNGTFQSSVKHGGVIYGRRLNDVWKTIPIFKGMRFNMETLEIHPSAQYLITYKKVNRKKNKEAMDIYKEKLGMAKAFLSCMERQDFDEDYKNTIQEYTDSEHRYYISKSEKERMSRIADSIFMEKPVDAVYLYMRAFDSHYYTSSNTLPSTYFKLFRDKFLKYVAVKHDAFDKEYVTHLEPMKASSWHMDITVNGKMVERLK